MVPPFELPPSANAAIEAAGDSDKLPAVRCPVCGGLDWYKVGNLLCCFGCCHATVVKPAPVELPPP